jgi:hypothetical protein
VFEVSASCSLPHIATSAAHSLWKTPDKTYLRTFPKDDIKANGKTSDY